MSDDDCDIFSSLRNNSRVKATPEQFYNPCNDSFSKELESELLDRHSTTKKASKVAKLNATAQPKGRGRKGKKNLKEDDKLLEAETATGGQSEELSRPLTPVSQFMLEMDQRNAKAEEEKIAEESAGPVSRRTRSSGRRVQEPVAKQPSPPKRKSRGKKSGTKSVSSVPPLKQISLLESLSGSITQCPMPTNRRQQIAEIAARSSVLDTIDLASAVAPRVEGFVNLDSDDEAAGSAAIEEPHVESENPPMDISLSWLGEIQHYKLRQHRKFVYMFQAVAERNGVDVNDVVIYKYDTLVEPTDTPHGIGLMKFHTLKGCAIKSSNSHKQEASDLLKKTNKFQLKVQGVMFKRPLVIAMKKKDIFKVLYLKCADELDCDVHMVKLFFDGELLDHEDTPKVQEMEGNEIIDLQLKT